MAEPPTRANSALAVGNFEPGFDDGEIQFRTGIDLGGTELTNEPVDPLIQAWLVSIGDHARSHSSSTDWLTETPTERRSVAVDFR